MLHSATVPPVRIAITGGTGFLGSTLARYLVREGHDVVVLDREPPGHKGLELENAEFRRGDVRDRGLLLEVFRGVDEVYHQSGLLGTAELQEQVGEAIQVNVAGTVAVFEAAIASGVPRVFYPAKPSVWLNTYTITKQAAEQFARMFNETSKTRICSLRYFNVYGPGQAILPIRKIIPSFAVQAMRGLPIEVFGDGQQTVDMVYSADIAELTVRFTRSGHVRSIPDCGSGVSMTVNAVAETVSDYFGNRAGIKYVPMRPGEVEHTELVADLTDLRQVIGAFELTPYRRALAETLDWYARREPAAIEQAIRSYGWNLPAPTASTTLPI